MFTFQTNLMHEYCVQWSFRHSGPIYFIWFTSLYPSRTKDQWDSWVNKICMDIVDCCEYPTFIAVVTVLWFISLLRIFKVRPAIGVIVGSRKLCHELIFAIKYCADWVEQYSFIMGIMFLVLSEWRTKVASWVYILQS